MRLVMIHVGDTVMMKVLHVLEGPGLKLEEQRESIEEEVMVSAKVKEPETRMKEVRRKKGRLDDLDLCFCPAFSLLLEKGRPGELGANLLTPTLFNYAFGESCRWGGGFVYGE